MKALLTACCMLWMGSTAWAASAVPVTIFHTNDLHSHFRPDKTPLHLGGIARLKSAIDEGRKKAPNSVVVDGGDWSEGNIYYTEGAGREVLKMMDSMGYDIAVVGNHDWLNGPDTMLDAVEQANPKFDMIGANFDPSQYKRAAEWRKRVLPFVVKEVNGAKIAFIGLATYEFIYDKYIAPIKITEPFSLTNDLAKKLKKVVDAVVVVSHNRVLYNQALLQAAPDVDLVIGAHDHKKLTAPVVVKRPGAPDGWIVETGCWGQYLGRVDMKITPRSGSTPSKVELVHYGLTQMDQNIPEDPVINAKIAQLESAIEARMGPIFTDHVAQSEIELGREGGGESVFGDFETDAYRHATGADIALDVKVFLYDSIHAGVINTVDVFNSNPAVWSPETGKTWTIKTLPIQGKTLEWIFNLLLFKNIPLVGSLYTSGVNVLYDGAPTPANPIGPLPSVDVLYNGSIETPQTLRMATMGVDVNADDNSNSVVRSIKIGGTPLDESRMYVLAGGGGVFETITTLNSMVPNLIPLDGMQDTGIEAWRAAETYIRKLTPLTAGKISIGGRIQTRLSDLGIYDGDVTWTPIRTEGSSVVAKLDVTVHNFGESASPESGPYLLLAKNKNGNNLAVAESYEPLSAEIPIGSIEPGQSKHFETIVTLTADRGVYAVTAMIRGNGDEANHNNDDVTRYFLK